MPELFTIPFDAGINQGIDPAVAPEGTLARITDGRIPRQGGIVKRFPTETVSQAVEPTGFSAAFGNGRPHAATEINGREVLALSGRCYVRDEGTEPTWVENARPSDFIPRKAHFIALDETAVVQSTMHVAVLGDTIAVTYAETETPPAGAVTNAVLILMDKSMVRRFTTKVAGRDLPRIFAVGSVFVWTYKNLDAVAGSFFGRTVDPATLTVGAATVIRAKIGNSDAYDAAPFDATTFVFLARSANAIMRVDRVDLAFATTSSLGVVCANSQTQVARVYGTSGEGVWSAWIDAASTVAHYFTVDATVGVLGGGPNTTGTVVSQMGWTRANATSAWLAYQDTAGLALAGTYADRIDTTAAVVASTGAVMGCLPASSPFNADASNLYLWVSNQTAIFPAFTSAGASRYSLVRLTRLSSYPIALVSVDLTSALSANYAFSGQPPAVAISGERYYFATRENLGNFSQSLYLYEFEDRTTRRGAWRQAAEACGAGVLTGGHLQEITSDRRNTALNFFNLRRGFDNGFLKAPDINIAAGGGGSGALGAGTYQAAVVFEYVDTDGRRHQSEPSAVRTQVCAANDSIIVSVQVSANTERESCNNQVRGIAALYLTTAGGSTFYRTGIIARSANTFGSAPVATFTLTATLAPSTAAEQIYTSGGELRNSPSPSHRFALVAHDALWLCGMWDPRMIERSKTFFPGTPPRFTLADQFRAIAPFDVSALAELDSQILVLGVDGIAVMSAEGPNNQGVPALEAPSFLSPLGLLPGGEMAVIRVPAGVIYPGRRGLYIVPRGGGDPEFIGSPIQGDLANVYGATAHYEPNDGNAPASRLVAFAIEDAAGVRYVAQLDEDSLQWVSVDALAQNTEIIGTWNGAAVYVPLDSTAQPIQKRAAVRNSATPSSVSAETDWCRPFGLLGWGYVRKVQLLATLIPDDLATFPSVLLEFSRDGAPFAALAPQSPAIAGVHPLEWQLPGDQPCNSIRFRVTATANGIGAILHGLTAECDAAGGIARLPPGSRA